MATSDLDGGGAERQFSHLARNLPGDQFEIHLAFWRQIFRYPIPGDLPVHIVAKSKAWHVFRSIWQTARLIDQLQPDVVFSQPHYVNMVTGTALRLARHQPKWVCRQVNDPKREMPPGLMATWARWALGRADQVVGPSEGVRQALVSYLKIPAERTVRIDNLADVSAIEDLASRPVQVEAATDVFTVVHVGRLSVQKNQAMLLRAFSRLRGKPAQLWVLGQGELREPLEALTESLGVSSQVRWLGFQENPFPLIRAADVFALSSDFEGLPNAVIEAMICGTPVVSTNCPFGPEELIDHERTGLLVPVGDAEAFGSALEALFEDRARLEGMGLAARAEATERFRKARLSSSYEALFASLTQLERP